MNLQEYRQKVEEIIEKGLSTHCNIPPFKEYLTDELVSLYEETPGFPADDENTAVPGKPEGLTLKQQIEIIVNDHDGKYQKGKVNAILSLLEPMQEKPESMQNIEGIKEKFNKQFACMKFNDVYWDFFEPYLQPQNVGGVTNKVTKKHNRPIEPVIRPDSPEGLIEEILRACFDSEYNGFNFARAERELSTLVKNLAYLTITRKKKAFMERFAEEGSFKVYGTPAEVFDFFLEDYDEKVQQ